MKVFTGEDTTLIVEGPAEVKIVDGFFSIFGLDASPGFECKVDAFKAAPFYTVEGGALVVSGGKVSCINGNSIPKSWIDALNKIKEKPGSVIVLGEVDTGKSGFITFLANSLLKDGKRVALIDADTGQSDIGPPTTIGLGLMPKPVVMLSEVPLYDAVFIGLTSPSGLLHRSVAATSFLSRKAKNELNADYVLINTTGWVVDPGGRDLKLSKIIAVSPEYIVSIGNLEHITSFVERIYRVIKVDPAHALRPRSREERRGIRTNQYARHFQGAEVKTIQVEKIGVAYSFLWTGKRLQSAEIERLCKEIGLEILWAEEALDALILVVNTSLSPKVKESIEESYAKTVKIITPEELKNVLVAFGGSGKMFLGLGIILDFNPSTGELKVYTNVKAEDAEFMQVGYIKIDPETFEEQGWIERWSL